MAADTRTKARMEGLRAEIREPLRLLVEGLQAGLKDNLRSVTVVGSSLTQDFHPKTSDVNTMVLLNAYDLPALNAVARLVPSLSRHRISAPLLVTTFHIDRSRGVFGIEFLDFQLIHETILGEDPLLSLQFDRKNVRLQCERELKAMLVRLRQGYVVSLGRKTMLRDLLISTVKGLAPVLRAMLWLVEAERPRTLDSTLRKAAGEFDVDLGMTMVVHHWRNEKPRRIDAEMESIFLAVLDGVDRLTTMIDGLEVQ